MLLRMEGNVHRTALDEMLDAIPGPVKGPPCTAGRLMQRLDPVDAAAVAERLHDGKFTKVQLSQAIKAAYGEDVPSWALQRHARGQCRCAK